MSAPSPERVRRLPVVDEYVEDGRSAVLVSGRAFTLSELPTLVLGLMPAADAADRGADEGWVDLAALAAQVEELVGPPEEGSVVAGLRGLLADLADHQLVELDPVRR